MLGMPLADPIVGLVISAAIIVLLWGTTRSIGLRLMDGIEPDLLERAERALLRSDGIISIDDIRLRWAGHRLQGDALVTLDDVPLSQAAALLARAEANVSTELRSVDVMQVRAKVGSKRAHEQRATPTRGSTRE